MLAVGGTGPFCLGMDLSPSVDIYGLIDDEWKQYNMRQLFD